MMLKDKTIVVLQGGPGSEREISLASAKSVREALRAAGARVIALDIQEASLPEQVQGAEDGGDQMVSLAWQEVDLAYNVIHGTFGEDGVLQALLEQKGVAYTGAGVGSSELAFDKAKSKECFLEARVQTPESKLWRMEDEGQMPFEFPFVVKPPCEGSSVGVHVVHRPAEWKAAFADPACAGKEVLAESFVKGKELTVGILGQQALPVVEIQPEDGFYDVNNKYPWLEGKGKTEYLVPAPLSGEVTARVQQEALKAHEALGIEVYSRVDVLLDDEDEPFVLEANTIPGMTSSSLLPKAAAVAGIDFVKLCETIGRLSLEQQRGGAA